MPPASLSSWNRAASIGSLLTTASRCRRCRDGSRGLGAAFYDWIDSGDIDQVVELLADDFVEHEEMPGLAPGREGVGQLFTMFQAAFPDMRWEAEDVLAAGDKVAARVRVSGSLAHEHWGVFDMMSLMQQLGVAPGALHR